MARNALLVMGLAWMVVAFGQASIAQETSKKQHDSRIVLLSDLEAASDAEWKRVEEVFHLVNSLRPDLVLVAGDITHHGTAAEYDRVQEGIAKIKAPVHLVPGRRDTLVAADEKEAGLSIKERHALKIARFKKRFGEDTWSVEFGEYQFVGFDSTRVTTPDWPNSSQEDDERLLSIFGKSAKPYKIFLTHFPPDALGSVSGTLTKAGVAAHLYGYTHRVRAGREPLTGRFAFNCGSATQPLHGPASGLKKRDYGVMYFDVYGAVWVCFWKPIGGLPRPLGVFSLVETLEK
jgi:predicted phosphodiesterase